MFVDDTVHKAVVAGLGRCQWPVVHIAAAASSPRLLQVKRTGARCLYKACYFTQPGPIPMLSPDILRSNPRLYLSWIDLSQQNHGGRVQKISVGAGFTCPNRDGSKGVGGCTFCNNNGFTPGYVRESPDDICRQIETGMEFLKRRYPRTLRWVAYFQAYSNTYGELQTLIKAYQIALSHPDIDGLVIGTRPDCVADELLDYLAELSKSHLIELELGIESTDDAALARVNRGHDYACSVDAIHRAAARGLSVCGHLMFGLPGETRESMLAGAARLSALPLTSLKFHQLQVVKGTQMAMLTAKLAERNSWQGRLWVPAAKPSSHSADLL